MDRPKKILLISTYKEWLATASAAFHHFECVTTSPSSLALHSLDDYFAFVLGLSHPSSNTEQQLFQQLYETGKHIAVLPGSDQFNGTLDDLWMNPSSELREHWFEIHRESLSSSDARAIARNWNARDNPGPSKMSSNRATLEGLLVDRVIEAIDRLKASLPQENLKSQASLLSGHLEEIKHTIEVFLRANRDGKELPPGDLPEVIGTVIDAIWSTTCSDSTSISFPSKALSLNNSLRVTCPNGLLYLVFIELFRQTPPENLTHRALIEIRKDTANEATVFIDSDLCGLPSDTDGDQSAETIHGLLDRYAARIARLENQMCLRFQMS